MKKFSKKPLSPHLQIYKPQITSILSISHRITGIILFFSTFLICFWLFSIAFNNNFESLINIFFSKTIGKTLLFFITLSFFYHLLNGIRHLFWDIGYGYKLSNTYLSGIFVVLLSLIINIYIWFF
tara:strand:- start:923 stop:1297 length:375 start_codon:yes stop_codon:yes gene_type:complete